MPRFRKSFSGVRGFEPRFSVRGPLKRDRAFLAQDFQFRYVATPVKSLPGEPEIELKSFDSFTRVDTVISARHTLGGGLILFPREVEHATMSTFRPPEVTPDFNQSGWSTGVVDRLALAPDVVLETTLSGRWFEINVNTDGRAPMVYAPQTQSGSFFNDQEREVGSLQWVEALSLSRDWRGQHVFKFGTDLQRSQFNGFSASRPVEIRRLDGSLAELTVFGDRTAQEVSGVEFAVFAQDRWRVGSRVTFELGLRLDRDADRRARELVAARRRGDWRRARRARDPARRLRQVRAADAAQRRGVSLVRAAHGLTVRARRLAARPRRSTFANVLDADLRTPEALRRQRRVEPALRPPSAASSSSSCSASGSHEFIVSPDAGRARAAAVERPARRATGSSRRRRGIWAASGGTSPSRTSGRRGTADLNNYDQFFGNLRNPIVRANENNLIPTDVRHRLLVRGTHRAAGQWDFAPVLELRSGFPWSAVDEFQDFVGPRNRAGRLPAVRTLDFTLARPWRFKKYRFRAGLKLYNVFGASAERDVQNNLTSPDYGTFFNPIERSIGFVFGSAK